MTALSVTGEKLVIYGAQKVSVAFSDDYKLIHEFLVANAQISCDGILGMDILSRIWAKIDIPTREVCLSTLESDTGSEVELSEAGELGTGHLSPTNCNEIPMTLRRSKGACAAVSLSLIHI